MNEEKKGIKWLFNISLIFLIVVNTLETLPNIVSKWFQSLTAWILLVFVVLAILLIPNKKPSKDEKQTKKRKI